MRLREAFAPDGVSHLSARRGGSPPPRPDQPPAEPFVAGPADAAETLAPPVDRSIGVKPSQAAKWRADSNQHASTVMATVSAVSGPTPGAR